MVLFQLMHLIFILRKYRQGIEVYDAWLEKTVFIDNHIDIIMMSLFN